MTEDSSEEAVRWAEFGRRLMIAISLFTVVLGGGMTALTAVRMRTMLELALLQRGVTIVEAAARAAFVPLSLEDRAALARVVSYYEGQEALVSLRVLDERGVEWARLSRLRSRRSDLLEVDYPIASPRGGGRPIGRVDARMDAGAVRTATARQVSTMLLLNVVFGAVILTVGLYVIRRLTRGMRALAKEAGRAEELSRSNRDLEEFAYIASHDLQAPLRRISGFAELLSDRYKGRLDAEADEHISRIGVSTERMRRLVQDLLTYSRAGSVQFEPVRTDMNQLLKDVLAELDVPIQESGAKIASDPLPVVIADYGQISRLLQNLIGNAIKFRGELPPVVRVSARRSGGGEYVFSVADNGIGIEPQFADDVFKMFRRLHPATAYPGTGIGLSIARKIVERHGGRIWVVSEAGKGSTFCFTLGAPGERSNKEE